MVLLEFTRSAICRWILEKLQIAIICYFPDAKHMWNTRCTILICEDNPDEVLLTERLLKKLQIPNPHFFVHDGEQAIAYLRGQGEFEDRARHPFPGALITDLRMPRSSGFDILQWLLDNPPERPIVPIVAWSSSELNTDVRRAYELGAHCFIPKVADIRLWEKSMQVLFDFWACCEVPEEVSGESQKSGSTNRLL